MHFTWYHKLGFGLLAAAWLAFASNMVGEFLVDVKPLAKPAYAVAGGEGDSGKPAAAEDAKEAPEARGIVALLASADPAKGAKIFKKCKACHTSGQGDPNRVGPNLWDIVGRDKGAAPGFKYSKALAGAGGAWTFADLDGFLTKPKEFLAGTKMGFAGIKKPADRAAVIAFLRTLSAAPKPLQ